MEGEFIPLTKKVDVGPDYHEFIDYLKDQINDLEVPNWILIPERASGEHATGNAWLGVVLSLCTGEEEKSTIDTRVAVDTDDRDRIQSDVGEVPEKILDPIERGFKQIEREVNMCVARMTYDTETRKLEDIELLFLLEDVDKKEESNEE